MALIVSLGTLVPERALVGSHETFLPSLCIKLLRGQEEAVLQGRWEKDGWDGQAAISEWPSVLRCWFWSITTISLTQSKFSSSIPFLWCIIIIHIYRIEYNIWHTQYIMIRLWKMVYLPCQIFVCLFVCFLSIFSSWEDAVYLRHTELECPGWYKHPPPGWEFGASVERDQICEEQLLPVLFHLVSASTGKGQWHYFGRSSSTGYLCWISVLFFYRKPEKRWVLDSFLFPPPNPCTHIHTDIFSFFKNSYYQYLVHFPLAIYISAYPFPLSRAYCCIFSLLS